MNYLRPEIFYFKAWCFLSGSQIHKDIHYGVYASFCNHTQMCTPVWWYNLI